MPLLLRLALKNLGRNRRRTLLTAVAVVAGIGLFVLGQAFIDGLSEGVVIAAEDGLVGHLVARPAGYPAQGFQHPVDDLLTLAPAARAFLDRSTRAWTERTLFSPLASNGKDSVRVRAIGYDPARDERVFPRTLWRVSGRLPAPEGDEVLAGRGVARLLALSPGDRLVLQVRTHRGAINALEVKVSGVLVANNTALDGIGVLVPQALAHRLVAAEAPTHVAVRLSARGEAEAFRPLLQQALGGRAEVVTWEDETRDLLRLQAVRTKALDVLVGILLALAGLGMANTILMAAHERVREVGTLRALGMTEGGVVGLFVLEGALVGSAASLLGVLWGGGLAFWWSRHPLDFSAAVQGRVAGDLSMSSLIYTQVQPGILAGALLFGALVAVAASVYPARVASRQLPADAVRAE